MNKYLKYFQGEIMKSFKQFIKPVKPKMNSGYFPVVVHGSHAKDDEKISKVKSGYFPVVVHGSHSTKKTIKEEEQISTYDVLKQRSLDKDGQKDLKNHYDYIKNHKRNGAILRYTEGSSSLNKGLIKGGKLSESHEDLKNRIDSVLNDAPPIHRDTTVFSGLGFDPRQHMDKNNHLTSRAYLSSSVSGRTAHSFAHYLDNDGNNVIYGDAISGTPVNTHTLQIHLPKGSNHGAYIEHISAIPSEKEFLFNRDTKFKINPKPEIRKEDNYTHHIWHATPV